MRSIVDRNIVMWHIPVPAEDRGDTLVHTYAVFYPIKCAVSS